MSNLVIYNNGTKRWHNKEELLHRENGPAVEWADGTKYWYINGKLHREDGPAVEYTDCSKYWYKNGVLHREDGPAREYSSGVSEYWINNKYYDSLEEGLMDLALK